VYGVPQFARLPLGMAVGLLALLPSLASAAEADAALRKNLAWQIALERVNLSPGLVDGKIGPKTRLATAEFQRVRGLPQTGQLDAATAALKPLPDQALTTYTVAAVDLAGVGPWPKDWEERSKLPRMAYESLHALLAEKFHTSKALLTTLNPGTSFDALRAGDTLRAPAVAEPEEAKGERLVVNLAEKTIRVLDAQDRLAALFHCSIAADKANAPTGQATVAVIVHDPDYTFDPEKWPDVKGITRKLRIPPGPRNPVGLAWTGLSLPGYGMHGTPTPEMIGKTGSHGCFRLTNWDALHLSKLVRIGMPVAFTTERGKKW
jgi:lipoprotein-anchoring transpeptidase ErfK/SrfK